MDGSCDSPRLISVVLVWLESLEFLAFGDAFELAFDEQPASVPTSTAAASVVANALRRVPVRVMCSSCV